MRRRDFIKVIAGSVAAWPFAADAAEPTRLRHVALLMAQGKNNQEAEAWLAALREGLEKLGWSEGRNIHLEFRWAGFDMELMQRQARELVGLHPDLIFTSSSPIIGTVLQLTQTIPVVFPNIVDPVGQGFAASLSRPGGNATGLVNLEPSMAGKWIEL